MRQVILYGSYAREDYNKDSDIDILIVVSDDMNPIEVEESLNDLLFEILLDENELCSVRAIPEKLFKEYNSPFLLNVKKRRCGDMKREIKDLLKKADRYLRSAELLLKDGDFDSCVSRCYYAMFYSAEAILLINDLKASLIKE